MTGNNFSNNNFGDAINMASLILGITNLLENRNQSAQNDVQSANDRQAQYLLQELNKKFEEQNQMLNQILTILKGKNNEQRETER